MSETSSNFIQRFFYTCINSIKITPVKRIQQLSYIDPIEKLRRMRCELFNISKKAKDIFIQNGLDISNAQSVQCYLEQQTSFFDKCCAKNFPFSVPQLTRINRQIIQNVSKVKIQDIVQKFDIGKTFKKKKADQETNNLRQISSTNISKENKKKLQIVNTRFSIESSGNCSSASITCQNVKEEISNLAFNTNSSSKNDSQAVKYLWWMRKRNDNAGTHNLTSNMIQFLQRETELNARYLQLYIRDINFIQENLHVTLHVVIQDVDTVRNFRIMKLRRQQIRILCKQAILSLIEPSKNAFVRYEKNLPAVINYYLSRGYAYHFGYPSQQNLYWSLLVISKWAKLLIRHPDTTFMRAISCTLGCNTQQILVLSHPEVEQNNT